MRVIDLDEATFERNTVALLQCPGPNGSKTTFRYGFFTCETCDVPEGKHGYLFDASIKHYCDDCGGEMVMWIRL